ncbi:unnamed protein product [Fraxinus pennsylvanica]|uniref:Gnk2-homologous domain-containing protein n=1 Tax=Fraxinus pennsylvanica TaxID=56036 RepID=A0AAD1ZIA7_9LAMI|nr:unnamed protein product [Fraxinus pennsylvanica]
MSPTYHFLFLFFLCIWINAESADPSGQFCDDSTKINSTQISKNIDTILPKLVLGTSQYGFIKTSYGKGESQIYGLAQCRGDVSSEDCSTCIQDAANEIRKRCPNQSDSRIWYEYCFLRYSTRNFFGQVDTGFGIYYYNVQNVTDPDPDTFNKELGALMDKISSEAVVPANKGLGKAKTVLTPFNTLYGLVQCTRDLSKQGCAECLAIAIGNLPTFCNDKKGCRVLYSSCYLRYELYPFYFPLDSQKSSVGASMNYHSYTVYKH